MSKPLCIIEGCARKSRCRLLCSTHYSAARLAGRLAEFPIPTWEEKFWAKVDKTETCWLWTAALTTAGYGQFSVSGRLRPSRRVSYELLVGPIPAGRFLDHICHEPRCVNPAHLRPATNAENLQNRSGAPSQSTTGIRGVTWHKRIGKWQARVCLNGKRIHADKETA